MNDMSNSSLLISTSGDYFLPDDTSKYRFDSYTAFYQLAHPKIDFNIGYVDNAYAIFSLLIRKLKK